jgi:glycosyltransferase involved in cell wall biosynthesis
MNKKPIISFCIPTYNRGQKVSELVNNILKFKGDDIEVVVLDNFSTDDTNLLLNRIKDVRFIYVKNEKNIGGIINGFKALMIANGEYSFVCLDKDCIDYRYIGDLINHLKKNKQVVFGHCLLNAKKTKADVLFNKGFSSVFNMAYLSQHSTGMYYKTEVYKELPVLKWILESNLKFGFFLELINAEMALRGNSLLINLPVFHTETKEESAEFPSFTYSNTNEMFFFPEKRFEAFEIYAKNLFTLELSNIQKIIVLKKIFLNCLVSSTLEFRNILNDPQICNHYHIKTKKVSIVEIVKIDFFLSKSLIKSDLPINFLYKIYICFFCNIKLYIRLVLLKLKSND